MAYRMQQQGEGGPWVAVDDTDGTVLFGPNISHRAVVEAFRADSQYGNDVPLISDYRGMD